MHKQSKKQYPDRIFTQGILESIRGKDRLVIFNHVELNNIEQLEIHQPENAYLPEIKNVIR